MENTKKGGNISLLNLPESTLDCILNHLSPIDLIRMSQVCTCLRDKCRSDPLWDNHIKRKWGRVIGDATYKEWQWHITIAREKGNQLNQEINQNGSLGSFSGSWPMLCLGSYLEDCKHLYGSMSNNFMMSLYFSLESGKFWFPAQLYRGLLVSDALVRYDPKSDSFQARQQSGCWRLIGNDIHWDELRSPSCVGHVFECLEDLKPEDHIEIQWKASDELPYEWWYAVIGHLDLCNENENYCRCHNSETLIVEFRQYPEESNMRRVKLLRNNNRELGNNLVGLYGRIRKLHDEDEIQRWKNLYSNH
ncbi:F-box protein At2g41170-like [Abrus precatorius]|uniref:F-box protein At2g41170-like n=1 Tax=Abrus precatorius TaxID=3816 RepID=A0A8B8L4G9_ABRPR|nr:F-box protein At2g41170-like [Abrus precatorius]